VETAAVAENPIGKDGSVEGDGTVADECVCGSAAGFPAIDANAPAEMGGIARDGGVLDRQRVGTGGEDAAAVAAGVSVFGDRAVADERGRVVAEEQAPAEGRARPGDEVAADGAVLQRQPAPGGDVDAAARLGRTGGDYHAAQGQHFVGDKDGSAGGPVVGG